MGLGIRFRFVLVVSLLAVSQVEAAQIPSSTVTGGAAGDLSTTLGSPNDTCPPGGSVPGRHEGTTPLIVTNNGQRMIDLVVKHQFYRTDTQAAVPDPIPSPSIVGGGTVAPHGMFSPGCTTYTNGDVNNPIYYVIAYAIGAEYHVAGPFGGGGGPMSNPPCTRRPVRISYCPKLTPDVPDGVYMLRAAQVGFRAVFQNGRQTDPGGSACIDRRTGGDHEGAYQQLECGHHTVTELFKFIKADNGCYLVRQVRDGLLTATNPANDDDGAAELLGLGDAQISSCEFDQARAHWQLERVYPPDLLPQEFQNWVDLGDFHIWNQANGKCIQFDGSDLDNGAGRSGGRVNAINNCGTKYQEFRLMKSPLSDKRKRAHASR